MHLVNVSQTRRFTGKSWEKTHRQIESFYDIDIILLSQLKRAKNSMKGICAKCDGDEKSCDLSIRHGRVEWAHLVYMHTMLRLLMLS